VAHRHDEDAAFYLELAAAGDVLELACGTGRLTTHLAQTAQRVVGVDLDPDMLAGARARIGRAPVQLVQLVRADMRRFHFAGRPFTLVAIPYNSLQLLTALEDQAACLADARATLAQPHGRLALEVSQFDAGGTGPSVEPELLAAADGIELWAGLEVDGALVRYHKRFATADTHTTIHEETITLRDYAQGEFDAVLTAGGFAIEAARPFRRGQLVVAHPIG
jgi:SAM-dependent methyltransferase